MAVVEFGGTFGGMFITANIPAIVSSRRRFVPAVGLQDILAQAQAQNFRVGKVINFSGHDDFPNNGNPLYSYQRSNDYYPAVLRDTDELVAIREEAGVLANAGELTLLLTRKNGSALAALVAVLSGDRDAVAADYVARGCVLDGKREWNLASKTLESRLEEEAFDRRVWSLHCDLRWCAEFTEDLHDEFDHVWPRIVQQNIKEASSKLMDITNLVESLKDQMVAVEQSGEPYEIEEASPSLTMVIISDELRNVADDLLLLQARSHRVHTKLLKKMSSGGGINQMASRLQCTETMMVVLDSLREGLLAFHQRYLMPKRWVVYPAPKEIV